MSACVPSRIEENIDLPIFANREEAEKVIASTGIERRHVCDEGVTASDLSVKAVERLLADMGWQSDSIDCLFYVCTSRDYIAPQTACILQDRLHLRDDCFVMDLPLGCAGWVYGMSVITSMMQTGMFKRGLLIAAETNTKNRNMKDRTVRPLFGDAATVTALEYDATWDKPMNFVFGVDGAGASAIMTKFGGMRHPTTPGALQEIEVDPGIIRKGTDMVVNGRVTLRVLPDKTSSGYNEEIELVFNELKHTAGERIDYDLQYVDEIHHDGGKIRFIIYE